MGCEENEPWPFSNVGFYPLPSNMRAFASINLPSTQLKRIFCGKHEANHKAKESRSHLVSVPCWKNIYPPENERMSAEKVPFFKRKNNQFILFFGPSHQFSEKKECRHLKTNMTLENCPFCNWKCNIDSWKWWDVRSRQSCYFSTKISRNPSLQHGSLVGHTQAIQIHIRIKAFTHGLSERVGKVPTWDE